MAPKPWVRVGDGPEVDFQVLRVREIRVRNPRNGSEHPRVVIDAPDWVTVVPVTPRGQVVLVRQFRCGIWAPTLEVPGGVIDPGEAPARAAARELEEETGFRAREILPLGVCHPNPPIQANRTHSFLALGCERVGEARPEAGEDIEVELVERDELPRRVLGGEITHALVLAALYYAELRGRELSSG